MTSTQTALWALVALPAATGVLLVLAGRAASRLAAPVAVAVATSMAALSVVVAVARPTVSMTFVAGGPLALRIDGLAALVVPTVAAVTLLVVVFAAADVRDARARFFGLMLVFAAAVQLTATAATLPALLAGWEVMGATSYALVAFWWRTDEHVDAGAVAFLTTRAGDLGLYLAAGAAVAATASAGLGRGAPGLPLGLDRIAGLPNPWLHVAAAGVLVAAFGKAAQLPFSFWLSRAMAGPSPVSALLHSAAMVAMGGYLLLRLHPLLVAAGWAADVAAWGGALTALTLGAVAVAQTDLKQLLAASTSAQLGFVVLGAGTTTAGGGVAGGTAHLIGHAATKALLFLAAGAWLSALGTKQLPVLRGAARRYPLVGAAFAVGALALAGVPPLALWATKDEVLAAARAQSSALYVVALAAAVLSAAYAGKVLGIVVRPRPPDGAVAAPGYDSEQRGTRHVGPLEQAPLLVLAAGAAVLGMLALPPVGDRVRAALGATSEPSASVAEMVLSGGLAVAALAAAAAVPQRLPAPGWARSWLGLEQAARAVVVRPTLSLARVLARFDDNVLDRAVMAAAAATRRSAAWAARVDDIGVDGLVRRIAAGVRRLGDLARRPQTGRLHQYYAQAVVGLGAAVVLLLVR